MAISSTRYFVFNHFVKFSFAALFTLGCVLFAAFSFSSANAEETKKETLIVTPGTLAAYVDFEGVHVQIPRDVHHYAENGWIGPDDPADATAEWGEEMLQATAEFYARFLDRFRTVPLPQPHTLP